MHAIMVRIGDPRKPDYEGIIKFLGVLLSKEKAAQEKKAILEAEFGLKMSDEMEQEVQEMGSLGRSIFEDGLEQGIERGEKKKAMEVVHKLYTRGMSIEQISEVAGVSEKIVKEWVKEMAVPVG